MNNISHNNVHEKVKELIDNKNIYNKNPTSTPLHELDIMRYITSEYPNVKKYQHIPNLEAYLTENVNIYNTTYENKKNFKKNVINHLRYNHKVALPGDILEANIPPPIQIFGEDYDDVEIEIDAFPPAQFFDQHIYGNEYENIDFEPSDDAGFVQE